MNEIKVKERKEKEQLLKDLKNYDETLRRTFLDWQENFYEGFAKVIIAGDMVNSSLRFPQEDEEADDYAPNGSVMLILDIRRAEYLMRLSYAKFLVNGKELSIETVKETQVLLLGKNRPFGFSIGLWMKPADKKIRENIHKSEVYYRKLPGYEMPKRPESVNKYIKGLLTLHLDRKP